MDTMDAQKFKAGTNVFAEIDGKESGPFYLVQIEGDKATLQGAKTHVVPVAALLASLTPAKEGK